MTATLEMREVRLEAGGTERYSNKIERYFQ